MSLPKALGAYADVEAAWNKAIERGGIILSFASKSSANHWRMRAYYFRKLLHMQQLAQSGQEVAETSTPYDGFRIEVDKADPTLVRILPRITAANITDLAGNPVELDLAKTLREVPDGREQSIIDDPLLNSALELRKRLLGE